MLRSDDRTTREILQNGVGVLTTVFIWGHSSVGRAPALHAGGRRFETAWLHQCGTRQQVAIKRILFDFVRFTGHAKCKPGGKIDKVFRFTERLLFNNMVVLSRAFWVQDDSECGCDDHAIFRNEHKTVSAKQT